MDYSLQLMSNGKILQAAPYHDLLTSSQEFVDLVNAHKETAGSNRLVNVTSTTRHSNSNRDTNKSFTEEHFKALNNDQLIKEEERERGNTGLQPYLQYLNHKRGVIYFLIGSLCHLMYVICQILQNSWMAVNVDNPQVSTLQLVAIYLLIGISSTVFMIIRSLLAVLLGYQSSKYIFSQLMNSLFRAPMSFYDSTPLGRILSRVSILNIFNLNLKLSFFL